MLPTIHLNGTSRDALAESYANAGGAVRAALNALVEAAPNARDYYPQGGDAFTAAAAEHNARCAALRKVLEELSALAEHVADAP
jgi:hypothetical protein